MDDSSTPFHQVRLVSEPITDERVTRVIRLLDDLAINQGCLLCQFLIENGDPVYTLDWNFYESELIEWLLTSDALNEEVEGLNTSDGFDYGIPKFEWYSSLLIDGYVAWLMARGGAYESFDRSMKEAKALGRDFVKGTFSERYGDVQVRRCRDQWSDWFRGTDHWDETLLFVDEAEERLWLLLFSDTD